MDVARAPAALRARVPPEEIIIRVCNNCHAEDNAIAGASHDEGALAEAIAELVDRSSSKNWLDLTLDSISPTVAFRIEINCSVLLLAFPALPDLLEAKSESTTAVIELIPESMLDIAAAQMAATTQRTIRFRLSQKTR